MRIRPLLQTGNDRQDIRRIIHAINYREAIYPVTCIGSEEALAVAPAVSVFGGLAVDRSVFRQLLPDSRWLVYAAGWAHGDGTHTATLTLQYEKDNGTVQALGAIVVPVGAAYTKQRMGPFDVFGTVGVPAGETVPIITLTGNVAAGGAGALRDWTLWLRLLPPKQ